MEENNDKAERAADGSMASDLAKCEAERDEYLAGWQRAKADLSNYKKGEAERFGELAKFANQALIIELIFVLDNFDLGLAALKKAGPVEKGVYMIRSHLEDLLKRHGLERIRIGPGEPFDPAIAEAIAEGDPPAGADYPPGTVIEEIEAGYRLHMKVIRPVRVKVSKSK